MKQWILSGFASTIMLAGCGAQRISPREEPADAAVVSDAEVVSAVVRAVDAGACLALGARCRGTAQTCCTGFCDFVAYGYNVGVCVAPQPEGEYCEGDRHCLSGRCVNEVCRSSRCVALGARCETESGCCQGFCTASSQSYAPGRCAGLQPAGASCEGPRWCQSGRCVDEVCAP